MSVLSILTEARRVIAAGWTQGEFYEVKDDRPCYCTLGAIAYASGRDDGDWDALLWGASLPKAALAKLAEATGKTGANSVAEWNDEAGRTVEEVLAGFDAAIQSVQT
ncbi:DUF6197 family protein [Tsuneonella sp. HG222]